MPGEAQSYIEKSQLTLRELESEIAEFQRKLRFVDFLCRAGEDSESISLRVRDVTELCAVLMSAYFNTISAPALPFELSLPFVSDLFEFTRKIASISHEPHQRPLKIY